MTLLEINTKLELIKNHINQWIEQGYTPTIEKEIALHNLQQIYDSLSGGKPVVSQAPACQDQEIVADNFVEQMSIVDELEIPVETFESQEVVAPIERVQPVVHTPVQPIIPPAQQPMPQMPTETVVATTLLLGQKISLTQRDVFVRELFWKDEAFFANEIRKFQEIKSLDEALIYVGEKYNWAASNLYAEQFISLLENYYK